MLKLVKYSALSDSEILSREPYSLISILCAISYSETTLKLLKLMLCTTYIETLSSWYIRKKQNIGILLTFPQTTHTSSTEIIFALLSTCSNVWISYLFSYWSFYVLSFQLWKVRTAYSKDSVIEMVYFFLFTYFFTSFKEINYYSFHLLRETWE